MRVCVGHDECPFIVNAQQCLKVQKWPRESAQIARVSPQCPSAGCFAAQSTGGGGEGQIGTFKTGMMTGEQGPTVTDDRPGQAVKGNGGF